MKQIALPVFVLGLCGAVVAQEAGKSAGPVVTARDDAPVLEDSESASEGRWYIAPAVGITRLHRHARPLPGSEVRGVAPSVTLRLGYDFADSPWALEGFFMAGTTLRQSSDRGGVLSGGVDALYHFDRYSRFDPFLAGGLGLTGGTGSGNEFWQKGNGIRPVADLGLGFIYHLNDNWGIRADYRFNFAIDRDWMAYSTANVGLTYGFGAAADDDTVSELIPLGPIEPAAQAYDETSEHVAVVRDVTPVGSPDMVLELFVQYDKDTAVINPSNHAALDELVRMIRLAIEFNPDVYITLDGHADRQHGSDHDYNQRLSEDRAKSIRTYLVMNGIDAGRIRVAGHSFDQPKYPVDLDNGTPMNRRTDAVIRGVDEETRAKIRKALSEGR